MVYLRNSWILRSSLKMGAGDKMKKKNTEVKTKRMVLQPMVEEEIVELIEHTGDEEMRTAYGEMLEGSRQDQENRIWYAPWKMILNDGRQMIGDLCFKGPVKNHAVEIGYGILPEYEGKGYMTEAVRAMTQWAFRQKDIIFVEAETDPENAASQRVLEKCGFVPDGTGKEGPRFVLESPVDDWSMIYMCLGMSIGMAIGSARDQMIMGMSIGMSLGLCVGMLMTGSARKEREKLRQKRKSITEND